MLHVCLCGIYTYRHEAPRRDSLSGCPHMVVRRRAIAMLKYLDANDELVRHRWREDRKIAV